MATLETKTRLRVRNDAVVHVRRTLLGRGKINVKLGQVVEPHDVLGEDTVNVGFSTLDLAEGLGTSPLHALNFLQRPIGSRIYKGELLALKRGLMGLGDKIITSPTDCIIEAYNTDTGNLRLKFLPKVM